MERQQPQPNGTENRCKLNPNQDVIIDTRITEYELNNHLTQVYFTGKIYLVDGKEKDVRFFKFKKSEKELVKNIFFQTHMTNYHGVLKAHFAAYNESHNLWLLCYDWFDNLLDEMQNDKALKKDALSEDYNILSIWWGKMIRNLFQTIEHIHSTDLFHKNLDKTSNYVVVSNEIKIVNVQGRFEDIKDGLNPGEELTPEQLWKLKIDDLKAFSNMLKNKILLPGVSWADRDAFLDFFDNYEDYPYPTFVEKLNKHPFLLAPEDRMGSFLKIWKDLKLNAALMGRLQRILDHGKEFIQYKHWDAKAKSIRFLELIYNYPNSEYKDESVLSLVRFLRNVSEHYMNHNIRVEYVDSVVRRLYPNLLAKLYTVLPPR